MLDATSLAVAWSALLMGLAGGAHCLAMCAAPCGALVGQGGGEGGGVQPVRWAPRGGVARRAVAFHAGRLGGYSAAGALAAIAMDGLAWLTRQATALHPVWTLMHVAVMAWGLMLLVQARQPAWVEGAGRAVWGRVRPLVGAPGGVLAAGFLWALMPCGLLYSALLVAALSGGPLQGALAMALFGIGSGTWLVGGRWAWSRIRRRLDGWRAEWGTRVAGGLLCGVAVWALWVDLIYKPSLWCR
ncbi:MAG: sulfite exporter TauE/SafE family protein [Acidovorax sp.]|uniref:sulfite exporter TauE/SafE family protein n=1 Tax=Acidovorax sp. TaxID=1872122 RepID=UPI0039E476A1